MEEVVRWLPPGSPWLNKGAGGTAPSYDSKRPSGSIPAQQNGRGRPVPQVQTGPQPYISKSIVNEPPYREVLTPPKGNSRASLPLVIAILLILAGLVVLALASGIIPGVGGPKSGSQQTAFATPGPHVYTGPTRKANGPDINVPQALMPPAIDGDLSDWAGSSPNPVKVPYFSAGNSLWKGTQDLSASFYFAWDANDFYVGAIITDDVHVQLPTTRGYNLYYGDDVELWFDTNLPGDFTTADGNSDDYQLGLSPGDFKTLGPEAVFWKPDKQDARNKLVKVAASPALQATGIPSKPQCPGQPSVLSAPRRATL